MSNFVGQIDELVFLVLDVVSFYEIDSDQWGRARFYELQDAEGNVFVWRTSPKKVFEVGMKISVESRVTRHEVYRGTKQTWLSRRSEAYVIE